jgi:spore coat polysaccharide biosynthesis predicted glycosyltransferase SpsG
MVGLFKLIGAGGVEFYELMLLTVDAGTLSLKVKHFNADFTAWEEKGEFVDFRLVKLEPDAVHFAGLSFYKRDADGFDGYIVFRSADGGIREEKLVYTRR